MNGREPFLSAAQALLDQSGCTIREVRKNTSGKAYTSSEDWAISVPEPKGAVSFGVFAHEVGHQMLHRLNGSTPRWQEEAEAWGYALAQFDRFKLPGIEDAIERASRSLDYAFYKAVRRGKADMADRIREAFPIWWERAVATNRWLAFRIFEEQRERKALDVEGAKALLAEVREEQARIAEAL